MEWFRFLGLAGITDPGYSSRPGCRGRVFDRRHDVADFYFGSLRHKRFQHAIFFGVDFGRNFVGLQSEERIARRDLFAGFFVPDGNDSTRDGFTNGGDFYFETHEGAIVGALQTKRIRDQLSLFALVDGERTDRRARARVPSRVKDFPPEERP